MTRDRERAQRISDALREWDMEAIIGSLPADVLLLSGYWPVTGTALAVATREGAVGVLAPLDEIDLARQCGADVLQAFRPGSLAKIETPAEAVRAPLASLGEGLGLGRGRLGYRGGAAAEASSYAAMHLYGPALPDLLREAFPAMALTPADDLVARLRAVKTPVEMERLRRACRIAAAAFRQGAAGLRAGQKETEAAALFQTPLMTEGVGFEGAMRAGGFVYCMGGPDSAQASGAYARSRATRLRPSELALVHGNSYADGYWTDITRTFCLGCPDDRQRGLYEAILAAHAAALEMIEPGVRAADVDQAARQVLEARGLGPHFKHATGHGVGFAAFDSNALPRVHPDSPDVLEAGMVFNVEPAVYFDGWGGLRHCDMVAVTVTGVELLTPFLSDVEQLVLM